VQDESWRTFPAYIAAFETYVKSQGCLYTDEADEERITHEMFADSSHISTRPEIQQSYMKIFWERIGPLMNSVLKP
jgi:hypothetical protein